MEVSKIAMDKWGSVAAEEVVQKLTPRYRPSIKVDHDCVYVARAHNRVLLDAS